MKTKQLVFASLLAGYTAISMIACKPKNTSNAVSGDAAAKAYVAPGKYDEFYNFVSGGFSGQMSVYGLPSGRLLRVIPVFSQDPEKGWGFSEETKPMLNTSHGNIPWDDLHHTQLSKTAGEIDGRWCLPYILFLASGSICMSAMNAAAFEALYSAFSRMHVQKTWDTS